MSKVFFKVSLPLPNIECPALRRRVTSVCRLQHVHALRVPNDAVANTCLISLVIDTRNLHATPEKFRHRTTILILL
jgi:hypothetical protein